MGLAVAGTLLATLYVAKEFSRTRLQGEQAPIHLELPYLGLYTLYSLARGVVAYCLSLVFAIGYGYWAAKDRGGRESPAADSRYPAEHSGSHVHARLHALPRLPVPQQ